MAFTTLFVVALLLSSLVQFGLMHRQMRHVFAHQQAVPAAFAPKISLAAHQKAAHYTLAKGRWSLITGAVGSAILVGWTLLGGLDALNTVVMALTQPSPQHHLIYQVVLVAAFTFIGSVLESPLNLYSTFGLEQRFGFNRTTLKLYASDLLKSAALAVVIGLPLMALVLWIMQVTGVGWWLWAWAVLMGVNLAAMVIYPVWIAPLFNQFKPLSDPALEASIQGLMQRCGFRVKGLFVMDGSKRSGHGNAYFTGLGAAKRVVFFDTLLASLNEREVHAVLAHELGHFKHQHVLKRLLMMAVVSFGALALLGWLSQQLWFFTALGVRPSLGIPNHALVLLLFSLVMPVFGFFITPLFTRLSRRDEFEADAYAKAQTSGDDLAQALLKLYEDNANTLTPDPWYARFYYSHPPASERIAALRL